MRVTSSTDVAQAAVSGFTGIHVSEEGQRVSLGVSNITGMQAGERVVNNVLRHVSRAVLGVKEQADEVSTLASGIATRDVNDAAMWA